MTRLRAQTALALLAFGAATVVPTAAAVAADEALGCLGDCDASGAVDVADLVALVRQQLVLPVESFCDAADTDASGVVDDIEVLMAVERAIDGCSGDPFEPDDSEAQARTIRCESRLSGAITPGVDIDWLRFRLDDQAAAVLEILGVEGDSVLGLYSATGVLLAEDDDSGVGHLSRIVRSCGDNALPAGDYLAKLRAFDTSEAIAGYDVILHCVPCALPNSTPTTSPTVAVPSPSPTREATPVPIEADAYEYDDVVAHAHPIGCGEIQRRTISNFDDVDMIRFDLPQLSSLAVQVHSLGHSSPNVELLDGDGAPIPGGFSSSLIRRTCVSQGLAAGRYHLRLRGFSLSEYEIAVACGPCEADPPTATATPTATFTPSPPVSFTPPTISATPTRTGTRTRTVGFAPDLFEPDNGQDSAALLPCGATQSHTLPSGDIDYVKLTLDQLTALVFEVSELYPPIRLYDSAGVLIDSYSYGFALACGFNALAPGTYYAAIGASPFPGSYHVSALCPPCSMPNSTATRTPTQTPTPGSRPPDAFEPDGTRANANRIKCGEVQSRSFSTLSDVDWMELTLTEPVQLEIRTTPEAYVTLSATGYETNGYGDISLLCAYEPAPAGEYGIRLDSAASQPTDYQVEVSCRPCGVAFRTPSPTRTAFVVPTRTPTPGVDSFEPDNSRETARTLACGGTSRQSIAPSSDADWRVFTVSGPSTVVVEIEAASTGAYLRFVLRDTAGDEIERREFSGGSYRITRDCGVDGLDAGTYYIEASSPFSSRADYELLLRCLPCDRPNPTLTPTITRTATRTRTITSTPTATQGPDSFEPDGDSASASAIACGARQGRSLVPAGDVDWVAFTLDGAARVVLDTAGDPGGDTLLTILDASLTAIATDDNSGPGNYSRVSASLAPGSYYARVEPGSSASAGVVPSYELHLQCLPPITPGTDAICGNGQTEADETCDDGNTLGGDGCAANCTFEEDLVMSLGDELSTTSSATLQTGIFALVLEIRGSVLLTRGEPRGNSVSDTTGTERFRADDIPVTLLLEPNAGQVEPISVPGLICACVRGVEVRTCGGEPPEPATDAFCSGNPGACGDEDDCMTTFGSGVYGAGVIGCGGVTQPDYLYTADSLTAEYTFARHPGEASSGAVIDMAIAIGTIMDQGTCAIDESDPSKGPDGSPCTDDDPEESRGFASLLLQTTGSVEGRVLNVNNQAGKNIDASVNCGVSPCRTTATGSPIACDRILAGDASGLCLASVFPSLDVPSLGDIVVPVRFCGQ